ncbi:MAG: universal stress protein [Rhodothermales bacterium]
MNKIRNILHPTDLSPNALDAMGHAIRFARKANARLHVLHVAPVFGEDPLRNAFRVAISEDTFYRRLRDEMDQKMLACLDEYDLTGLDVCRVHSRGVSAADVILNYVEANEMDLVVMGTHGYGGLRKILLGSTALKVLRNAACDVLTVPMDNEHDIAKQVDSILVPIDFTSKPEELLANSVNLANLFSCRIDVLHVIESIPVPIWGIDVAALDGLYSNQEPQIKNKIKQLIAPYEGDAQFTISVVSGQPSKIVTEFSRKSGNAMVVLAPNCTSWLERMPMASVTEYILSHSSSPVYTLQSKEEEPVLDAASQLHSTI